MEKLIKNLEKTGYSVLAQKVNKVLNRSTVAAKPLADIVFPSRDVYNQEHKRLIDAGIDKYLKQALTITKPQRLATIAIVLKDFKHQNAALKVAERMVKLGLIEDAQDVFKL